MHFCQEQVIFFTSMNRLIWFIQRCQCSECFRVLSWHVNLRLWRLWEVVLLWTCWSLTWNLTHFDLPVHRVRKLTQPDFESGWSFLLAWFWRIHDWIKGNPWNACGRIPPYETEMRFDCHLTFLHDFAICSHLEDSSVSSESSVSCSPHVTNFIAAELNRAFAGDARCGAMLAQLVSRMRCQHVVDKAGFFQVFGQIFLSL